MQLGLTTVVSPAPIAGAAALAPGEREKNELVLAGVIGEQLSEPLSHMTRILQEVTAARGISRVQIDLLNDAITSARRIGMQSQQIARLAGGRLRQSHERLSLDSIVNQTLDDRLRAFKRTGIEVYRNLKPVEVIVDAGLLSSVVETAVDWAAQQGQRLVVSLEIKNWPEHGMLWIKASQTVAWGETDKAPPVEGKETISWYLLEQIAQAMGVMLTRAISPGEVMLTLEFSRTVKQLEGLTAVEVDTGGESSPHSDSKPMAGHRLLLVTTDEALRLQIKDICRTMGLVLDTVPTTLQAVRFCELDKPHMIIIDERLRDPYFDELHRDLQRYDPNLPFVEIANQPDMLEMASWVSGSMTRVSRDSVRMQMATLIVFELAKVI